MDAHYGGTAVGVVLPSYYEQPTIDHSRVLGLA